jgi:acetyl esterase/lipase
MRRQRARTFAMVAVAVAALLCAADARGQGAAAASQGAAIAPGTAARAPIVLWPEGVPGAIRDGGPEVVAEGGRVSNVHNPTLTPYLAPEGKRNGTAVIICPGGGYVRLAADHEGRVPAEWFNSLGVSAFILRYRLKEYGHPAPLRDVLRAVRTVRSNAATWGIVPDRIGVMGFSAGGHLAASSGTLFDSPDGRTGAALDSVSARPDFLILVYPVIQLNTPFAHAGSRQSLLGAAPAQALVDAMSLDTRVTKDTPPTFLVHGGTDTAVPAENSVSFFLALRRAGVPAEIHVYEKGAHGFGLQPGLGPISDWPARCAEWLKVRGLL